MQIVIFWSSMRHARAGLPRDQPVFAGLHDRSSSKVTWRGKLPAVQGVKMQQILIRTIESPTCIVAVLCILMTADNGTLAILNSFIHPQ